MLSPGEVAKIAENLGQLSLDPVTYFAVVGAITQALTDGHNEESVSQQRGMVKKTGNGAYLRAERRRRFTASAWRR